MSYVAFLSLSAVRAKDRAKALGATWQPDKKRWVVPAGRDLAPFQAWLS
jgi:hypothetical protein